MEHTRIDVDYSALEIDYEYFKRKVQEANTIKKRLN